MKAAKKGTIKKQLAIEIQKLPSSMAEEILDFARFLQTKEKRPKNSFGLLAESALKKDWFRPEEDKAWENL